MGVIVGMQRVQGVVLSSSRANLGVLNFRFCWD